MATRVYDAVTPLVQDHVRYDLNSPEPFAGYSSLMCVLGDRVVEETHIAQEALVKAEEKRAKQLADVQCVSEKLLQPAGRAEQGGVREEIAVQLVSTVPVLAPKQPRKMHYLLERSGDDVAVVFPNGESEESAVRNLIAKQSAYEFVTRVRTNHYKFLSAAVKGAPNLVLPAKTLGVSELSGGLVGQQANVVLVEPSLWHVPPLPLGDLLREQQAVSVVGCVLHTPTTVMDTGQVLEQYSEPRGTDSGFMAVRVAFRESKHVPGLGTGKPIQVLERVYVVRMPGKLDGPLYVEELQAWRAVPMARCAGRDVKLEMLTVANGHVPCQFVANLDVGLEEVSCGTPVRGDPTILRPVKSGKRKYARGDVKFNSCV